MSVPGASPEVPALASAPAPASTTPASMAPAPAAPAPGAGLPGKRFLVVNAVALAVGVVLFGVALAWPGGARGSLAPALSASGSAPGTFSLALWDDGKVEVSHFTVREGASDPGSLQFQIVGRGLFHPNKARANAGASRAVDSIQLVQTDEAPRRTLAVRVARDEPTRLLEASLGLQEERGNAFVLVTPRGPDVVREVLCSWENEGDRTSVFPSGTWLEDQLPLTLRGLDLTARTTRLLSLIPTLATRGPAASHVVAAKVSVQGEETLALALGPLPAIAVRVDRADGASATYWFGKEEPHVFAKWVASDGRQKELRRAVSRVALETK